MPRFAVPSADPSSLALPPTGRGAQRWRAGVVVATVSALLLGLPGQPPAFAAPAKPPNLTPQAERVVPGGATAAAPYLGNAKPGATTTAPATGRLRWLPRTSWPAAGTATVELPSSGAASMSADAVTTTKAGALPVAVGAAAGGKRPGKVTVQILDRKASTDAGRDGPLLRVGRADAGTDAGTAAGTVRVSVDYSGFRDMYGADWANRLRLVRLPECALTAAADPACAPVPLGSTNAGNAVTADVPLAAAGTISANATGNAAGTSLLALTAGPSGSTGSFAASSMAASSTWSAGGSSGDFGWNYPMRVPPSVNGPSPNVGLAYSSGSVDGHTAASNNQPSWIGEGFDFWPGYVQRRYKPCAEDMGGTANNTTKTGDQCWGTDNAFLSLNGTAVELVRDDATGAWRPRADDGAQITVSGGAANGDNDGEHWKVVTADGTQYFFGLNHLPGWTPGKPETNSALLQPVFGNNPNEQCHAATFAASSCSQAYTWNLDYVVDVNNNTMSYWYSKETNKYARNLAINAPVDYDRSAWLSRIEYGTRQVDNVDSAYTASAPTRVLFDDEDRCLASCQIHDAAHWTDTPWDQSCTGAPCNWIAPTYWTTRRLASVTTEVWNGTGYRGVDRWTLRHEYPPPNDTTRAGLWLAGIGHTGLAGDAIDLPEVTIAGVAMANRVDAVDASPPMNWFRVNSVRTESGGEINVEYSAPDCIAGVRMPSAVDTNTLRCFPVRWTPDGRSSAVNDYFHKYVVVAVVEADRTGKAPRRLSAYEYGQVNADAVLWHYDDDDGLVQNPYKTWSQWRGYEKVITRRGDPTEQSVQENRYFRGMHGDKVGSGTRTVNLLDSEGNGVLDEDQYAGMSRETISFTDATMSTVAAATVYQPWKSAATATRTVNGITTRAYHIDTGVTAKRTLLDNNRGYRRSRTTTEFDTYGMVSQVFNEGDLGTTADDQCSRLTYARNTGKNLLTPVQRMQTFTVRCGQAPATADDLGSDVRYSFDGKDYGVMPVRGEITRTEQLTEWTPSASTYTTIGRSRYDTHGRVVETWDAADRHSTTTYTPEFGGPVTKTVTANDLQHTATVEVDPAWGLPIVAVDANGKRTEESYDALGRLTGVWLPGRVKGTDTPDVRHSYRVRTDGAVAVITEQLNAAGGYNTVYRLFDALLRERQTQAPAYDGGRIVTDIMYDTVGRPYKTNSPYIAAGAAGVDLFTPTGDQVIPSQAVISFDANGRPVTTVRRALGVEKWRGRFVYAGDRVDSIAQGTAATSRFENVRGKLVELRTYHGPSVGGDYDAITYGYNKRGDATSVTDQAGNTWRYKYDLRGRLYEQQSPDGGTSIATFGTDDQLETTKDANGDILAFTYDSIGRRTSVREGTVTGKQRIGYTYDTLIDGTVVKGQLATTTRYDGENAYVEAVRGYTDRYQPSGTRVTIPAVEGALAGTYDFDYTYKADGSPASASLPAGGGLPAETVQYGYETTLGLPSSMSGASSYVTGTTYTRFAEPAVVTRSTGSKIVQTALYYTADTRAIERMLTVRETSPSAVADLNYTYDVGGQMTSVVDQPAGGQVDRQCFSYDWAHRLTEAWTPSAANCTQAPSSSNLGGPAQYWQGWSFDAAGNRKQQVKHATSAGEQKTDYSYPGAGNAQPHTLTSASVQDNAGTRTFGYTYDKIGNTLTRPGVAEPQNLTWDKEGALRVVKEGTKQTTYLYGADGSRLIRRDATTVTLYLGTTELRLDTASNTVSGTRYYSHTTGTVAMRNASGVTWLISDHHGTGQWAVKSSGPQTVTTRRTAPFGEIRGAVPAWPNDRGFVGGIQDGTGLTELGLRQYDQTTGRFISLDPVTSLGDGQQLNGYAYANNSPVTISDRNGAKFCDKDGNLLCKLRCIFGCDKNNDTNGDGTVSVGELAGSHVKATCHAENSTQAMACGALAQVTTLGVDTYADLGPIPVNDVMRCSEGSATGCAWVGLSVLGLLGDAATAIKGVQLGAKAAKGAKSAKVIDSLRSLLGKLRSAINMVIDQMDGAARNMPGLIKRLNSLLDSVASVKKAISVAGRTPKPPVRPKTVVQTTTQRVVASSKNAGNTVGHAATECVTNSFVPGTKVLMGDGSARPIEAVGLGDTVLATDPATGRTAAEPVAVTIRGDGTKTLVAVTVDVDGAAGDGVAVVTATDRHPFWSVRQQAWVDAVDLRPGDLVLDAAGAPVPVLDVAVSAQPAATVYNLTVEQVHTYYVLAGDVPVLVHNCTNPVTHDPDALADAIDDDTWFHYTDAAGEDLIMRGGVITQNSKGVVYFTQDMVAHADALNVLFAGNILYGTERGSHIIAFRIPKGILQPGVQYNEVVHNGSFRFTLSDVIYHGPNPFG